VAGQAQSESRIKSTVKETWQNDVWLNNSKSDYYYDAAGRQNEIVHTMWRSGLWGDTTVVTNQYHAQGLLAEREERKAATDFVLSHEVYDYDENGNLTRISFPDTPWFRARGIFDVHGIPFVPLIFIEPYILVSHIHEIQYEYSAAGFLDQINYFSSADEIPDSIFIGPKLHPFATRVVPAGEYSNETLSAYRDSLWGITPVDTREVIRSQRFSYQTNGKQIAVLSHLNPFNPGREIDTRWDFYDIWHPGEVRTLWFYSNEEPDSANASLAGQFRVSHLNPNKRQPFFSDLMGFWLSTGSDAALYNTFIAVPAVLTRHLASKQQENISVSNYHIPGNYYQYFDEPRFRQSYPIKNKRLLKSVEQFLLPLQKLSSPIHYGFSWDFNFQWIDATERTYQYDESGRLLESVINTWEWDRSGDYDPKNGWWQKDSKYEFAYEGAGNGSMILRYVWNSETGSWENKERISFTYEDFTPSRNQPARPFDTRLANHPNPFNTQTSITFRIENPSIASLKIYDITGRLVRTILSSQKLSAAEHAYSWDGKDASGRPVSTGLYLYRLELNNFQRAGRCLFLK
jgi:hypothetical protein